MDIKPSYMSFDKLLDYAYSYRVPHYQRNYSWTKQDQLKDFWEDIRLSVDEDSEHFIGAMYFVPDGANSLFILDGQQRLTSLLLILKVLQNEFSLIDNESAHPHLGTISNSLYNVPRGKTEKVPKILLNISDREYFIKLAIAPDHDSNGNEIIPSPTRTSQQLICDAYKYFSGVMNSYFADMGQDHLTNFYCKFVNKITMLCVEINSLEDAQKIFETLNDRGLELSESDLIKNYLLNFYEITDESIKVQLCEKWDVALNQLKGQVSQFLKHFMNYKYGQIRTNDIYKKVKEKVIDRDEANLYFNEFIENCEIYKNIDDPSDDFWEDKQITKLLLDLKTLNVQQVRMLILALYHKYYQSDKDFFKKTLKKIVCFTFSYNTICGNNPNALESFYVSLANDIYNNRIEKTGIKKKINEKFISREEFKLKFLNYSSTNSKIIKYILIEINNKILNDNHTGELCTIIDNADVNLEHIIPKTEILGQCR